MIKFTDEPHVLVSFQINVRRTRSGIPRDKRVLDGSDRTPSDRGEARNGRKASAYDQL